MTTELLLSLGTCQTACCNRPNLPHRCTKFISIITIHNIQIQPVNITTASLHCCYELFSCCGCHFYAYNFTLYYNNAVCYVILIKKQARWLVVTVIPSKASSWWRQLHNMYAALPVDCPRTCSDWWGNCTYTAQHAVVVDDWPDTS